jgi:hypothetical protein
MVTREARPDGVINLVPGKNDDKIAALKMALLHARFGVKFSR